MTAVSGETIRDRPRSFVPAFVRRRPSRRLRDALAGYAFISPWIVGFLLLSAGPMVASLYLSLTDYSLIVAPDFVGAENYANALTEDPLFWQAVGNTLFYVGIGVPVGIAVSLLLAVLLDQGIRGTKIFRTLYFLPSVTPIVASVLVWRWIFQPEFGIVNFGLREAGLPTTGWLADLDWVKPTLIFIGVWGTAGGSRMLIFLAGLQNIPQEMYEAAAIDGASRWQRFMRVTLPLLSPAMFFNLILGLIDGFRVFTLAYVATEGGPANESLFYVIHLFNQAFRFLDLGYGSALAWLLFAVVLVLTLVQIRASRRWVYYERDTG